MRFLGRVPGVSVALTGNGMVITAAQAPPVQMRLVGADEPTGIEGVGELPGRSNYFVGSDPDGWHTGIPQYRKVRYESVWSGVNLVYYGNPQRLEYDFIVAPGADPGVIELEFSGMEDLRLDALGDLVLATESGELRIEKPVIYQESGKVAGRFALREGNRVGFEIGEYDPTEALVIDPVLAYSALVVRAEGPNYATAVAVDTAGNVYVAGRTYDVNLMGTYVLKLNPSGTELLFSTFLGQNWEAGEKAGIVLDDAGNIYVAGTTFPGSFPATGTVGPGAGSNAGAAFLAKLSPAGDSLLFAILFGGMRSEMGVAVAAGSDKIVVVGRTESLDFPVQSAFQETPTRGFATAFDTSGALLYSTYLGEGRDYPTAVAVDDLGRALIAGDGFVDALAADGASLSFSRDMVETPWAIATGGSGAIYVAGHTESESLATTAGVVQPSPAGGADGFVMALSGDGADVLWATYLGGEFHDVIHSIAVGADGDVYVAGHTMSLDFPTVNALQAKPSGPGCRLIRSDDGGVTWGPRDSGLAEYQAMALSVNQEDPNDIVVTTLDGYEWPYGSGGIYRTSDGGLNWTLQESGPSVWGLGRAPFDPNLLYALSPSSSPKESVDGGSTWVAVGSTPEWVGWFPPSGPIPAEYLPLRYATVDPSNPGVIYAAGQSTILKWPDGGPNWIVLASGLSWLEDSIAPGVNRPRIAVAPSDPNTLYVSTDDGIFRSQDGGVNWRLVSGQFHARDLAVDPSDASVVYVVTPGVGDAFVAKLNPEGSAFEYSTFFGGGTGGAWFGIPDPWISFYSRDGALGVAVDSSGNAYVAGVANTRDFPTTEGVFQQSDRQYYSPDRLWSIGFVAKIEDTNPGCMVSLGEDSGNVDHPGEALWFTVVSPSGCGWSAASQDGWLSVADGAAGSGVGTVTLYAERNTGGARTGMVTVGSQTFSVHQAAAPLPPEPDSAAPSSGQGAAEVFQFTYTDPNGFAEIEWALALFHSTVSASGGCHIQYNHGQDSLWLMDDSGAAWLGPVTPGSASKLENSQCSIDATGSSASGSGTSLTLNVDVTFQPAFAGKKNIYMSAAAAAGQNSGWQTRGTWTTTDPRAPEAVAVTPETGGGAAATFQFRYSDPDGFENLSQIFARFHGQLVEANGCYLRYDRAGGSLSLMNDAGSSWMSGSGTLENSQCAVDTGTVSASGSGSSVTLTVEITFKAGSFGTKN
ncbi:MAG: hypothetical protein GY953_02985, partial [bacterium]|nr:hypothetical protein [bacterium]